MKSHDLGQFLLNSKRLNEIQLFRLIVASKNSDPTLAVEALFLQLVSAEELTAILRLNRTLAFDERVRNLIVDRRETDSEFQKMLSVYRKAAIDESVRTLITSRQANRAEELRDGQSIRLAQGMLDNGLANFFKLERILDAYQSQQVPPLESMMTVYYEHWKNLPTTDFPFAIDLMRGLHTFLSETFNESVIILPPSGEPHGELLGASVKLAGTLSAVTGILADRKTFFDLAVRYDDSTKSMEDSIDAIAELLNVFIGHFAVRVAMQHGLESEPEPPRHGEVNGEFPSFRLMTDVGIFYVYINGREIFELDD